MKTFTELVEIAAQLRHEPAVPRQFITLAMWGIERGFVSAKRYACGEPLLEDVYLIATRLEKGSYRLH